MYHSTHEVLSVHFVTVPNEDVDNNEHDNFILRATTSLAFGELLDS